MLMSSRILIAEDEEDIQTILTKFINSKFEAIVTSAKNGTEALEKISSKKYDLLITDIRMPDMDGIQLITNIKKFPSENSPDHIWIMSGYINADQVEILSNGNITTFQKPLDLKILEENLLMIISPKKKKKY